MRFCSGAVFWVFGGAALRLWCGFWFLGGAAFLFSCGFWASAANTFLLVSKYFVGAAGGGPNVITAAQQGAAPDRPQCCRFSGLVARLVVDRDWRAAGELSVRSLARGVKECENKKCYNVGNSLESKKMKRLFLITLLLSCVAPSYGAAGFWPVKDKPPLSLSQALPIAQRALHKRAKDFHCLGAHLAKTRSPKGDWTFTFGSANGEMRWVVVSMEKKVWISKVGLPS